MDQKARNKRANLKKQEETRPRGAPRKPNKIQANGLRKDQNEWLDAESEIRGLPKIVIHREALDWYITAKETRRATVDASKQFDDTMTEGGGASK